MPCMIEPTPIGDKPGRRPIGVAVTVGRSTTSSIESDGVVEMED